MGVARPSSPEAGRAYVVQKNADADADADPDADAKWEQICQLQLDNFEGMKQIDNKYFANLVQQVTGIKGPEALQWQLKIVKIMVIQNKIIFYKLILKKLIYKIVNDNV